MEQDIYVNHIHLDRCHLRAEVTEESVSQLADSIRLHGLLQAIVVTPRLAGGYRLIAGRRRLVACQSLQYQTVPCRIIEDPGLDEIPALAENLMRLQMNPLEEARACKMLHEQKGLSIAEICERTNHGTSWVQDRLALLELPEHYQQAVALKHISMCAAMRLMAITEPDYRDYLLNVAKINGATISQVNAWVMEWQSRQLLTAPGGLGPPVPQTPGPLPCKPTCCASCDTPIVPPYIFFVPLCPNCSLDLAAAKRESVAAIGPPALIESRPGE